MTQVRREKEAYTCIHIVNVFLGINPSLKGNFGLSECDTQLLGEMKFLGQIQRFKIAGKVHVYMYKNAYVCMYVCMKYNLKTVNLPRILNKVT